MTHTFGGATITVTLNLSKVMTEEGGDGDYHAYGVTLDEAIRTAIATTVQKELVPLVKQALKDRAKTTNEQVRQALIRLGADETLNQIAREAFEAHVRTLTRKFVKTGK